MNRVSVAVELGPPVSINPTIPEVLWENETTEGFLPELPPGLFFPETRGEQVTRFALTPALPAAGLVTLVIGGSDSAPLATWWTQSESAITLQAGGNTWTLAGPAASGHVVPDEREPYTWLVGLDRGEPAIIQAAFDFFEANPTASATLTLAATNPDAAVQHLAAWLVRFPDLAPPINVWTGEGPLTLGGIEYSGLGQLVAVGRLNSELSQPVHEMTLSVSLQVLSAEQRALFLADPGPRRVEVGQAYSLDGASWEAVPRVFRGRLSAPRLNDDVYQINVVTRIADIDRGRPLFWSHEAQAARWPGDLGLQHMRRLAEGVDIKWPP